MSVDQQMFEKGLSIRREVLGAEYVDNAMATADDFNRPLQELVTQYCWGEIWGRPGLDRKTRSLLTLAALTALCKPNQIKVHVAGALANGATVEEIRETFLHTMVYAGVPCGAEAFNAAAEVLARHGAAGKP
jgi:4-carboxymuconolactone decarboxylase